MAKRVKLQSGNGVGNTACDKRAPPVASASEVAGCGSVTKAKDGEIPCSAHKETGVTSGKKRIGLLCDALI